MYSTTYTCTYYDILIVDVGNKRHKEVKRKEWYVWKCTGIMQGYILRTVFFERYKNAHINDTGSVYFILF